MPMTKLNKYHNNRTYLQRIQKISTKIKKTNIKKIKNDMLKFKSNKIDFR